MANDEVRSKVLEEWDIWAAKNLPADHKATVMDGIRFFSHLREFRPQIFLRFRSSWGDPWQTVHAWLVSGKKIPAD